MAVLYPSDWIEQLRGKSDLVEVVSQYAPVAQKGGRYWACCPFHQEKTPSFSIDADQQLYHCFGCKKSGDVIRFVMDIERLDFVDAVKFLAERANISPPDAADDDRYVHERAQRERLYSADKLAARFFHDQLFLPEGERALAYLKNRGLTEPAIRRFGLGYAPESWDALIRHAEQAGFTPDEMIRAGLAHAGKSKPYDAFRNRIMYPIITPQQRVVGFGGRVMDQSQPKYINTPQTPIFNKRDHLYGLNLIRKRRDLEALIVVEGYMDVIGLYQQGVDNAVASLGTALTQEQAKRIKRFVSRVFIAYDGDTAGQMATIRGMEILDREGLEVIVVSMPEGLDPDELIRRRGREEFDRILKDACPLIAYKMRTAAQREDLSTSEGRSKYAIAAAEIVAAVKSPIQRENYLKRLQAETGFSLDALNQQLAVAAPKAQRQTHKFSSRWNANIPKETGDLSSRTERAILMLLCSAGEETASLLEEMEGVSFTEPSRQQALEEIFMLVGQGRSVTPAALMTIIGDEGWAGELLTQDAWPGDKRKYLLDCLKTLRIRALEEEIHSMEMRLPSIPVNEMPRFLEDLQSKIQTHRSLRENAPGKEGQADD